MAKVAGLPFCPLKLGLTVFFSVCPVLFNAILFQLANGRGLTFTAAITTDMQAV